MSKRLLRTFFVFAFLLFALSCGSSDKEEIEEILSKRQQAYETKNLELYMSCIYPNYNETRDGKVIGIQEVKKNFQSNVSVFDEIKLSHLDRSIYPKGEKAEVFQKTKVDLKIEKDEGHFLVRERLDFEKINGKWMIVKESDADFLKGFVFGG